MTSGSNSELDTNQVIAGDCLEVLAELPENSVHAVVCDPLYGLAFMGKSWDDFEPKEYQEWCEEWASECLRVLRPGGHLLAFSGTRTYHRLATGVEDAGFEIRDKIDWLYGTGFPKSLDVSKAIDEKLGVDRDVVGTEEVDGGMQGGQLHAGREQEIVTRDKTVATSGEAKQWDGWGTALKPAHEPVVVARKPLSEDTVAENVMTWGTGALNIDDCRVGETGGHEHPGRKTIRYRLTRTVMVLTDRQAPR